MPKNFRSPTRVSGEMNMSYDVDTNLGTLSVWASRMDYLLQGACVINPRWHTSFTPVSRRTETTTSLVN